jgi:hypothetical protein
MDYIKPTAKTKAGKENSVSSSNSDCNKLPITLYFVSQIPRVNKATRPLIKGFFHMKAALKQMSIHENEVIVEALDQLRKGVGSVIDFMYILKLGVYGHDEDERVFGCFKC